MDPKGSIPEVQVKIVPHHFREQVEYDSLRPRSAVQAPNCSVAVFKRQPDEAPRKRADQATSRPTSTSCLCHKGSLCQVLLVFY